jgi:hypothetical protein
LLNTGNGELNIDVSKSTVGYGNVFINRNSANSRVAINVNAPTACLDVFGNIRFRTYNAIAAFPVSAVGSIVFDGDGTLGTAPLPKTYTAGNATTITPANAIDIGGTMSADIAIAANTKKFSIIDGVFEAINNRVRILANNIRARMSVLDATGKAITDIYVQASEAMMMGTNNAKAAFMGISLNANPLQPEIIINTPDTANAIAGSVLTLQDPAYGTARWVAPQVKTLLWTITRGANGNVMGTGGIAPLGKLAILSAEISSGVVGYQNTFYPVTSWRFGNSLDCIVLPSNGQDSIYFTSQTSLNTNPSTIGTFPTGTDFQVRVNYIILS